MTGFLNHRTLPTAFFALAAMQYSAPSQSQPAALILNAKSKIAIVLPQAATLPEQTAARELDDYLTRITGGNFTVAHEPAKPASTAIYIGNTTFAKAAGITVNTLASEEWRIKAQKNTLILAGGGTRGTLYATYRFLEDNAGVRWWNPWEETVPSRRTLSVSTLDKKGKPAFSYRDIYMVYGNDKGRFAIRNRLNREGDATISAEYGGGRDYGPPAHVHTVYNILSPDVYYKDHPDWFLVRGGGIPTPHNSQLHMSNPEMRQEFLKLLRENIRKSHQDAREKGLPLPDVFSVSQADNTVKFEGPNDAALLAENGGAESAIMLDFVNFLADNIKEEFPGVYVDTLAYYSGEKAPTKIRPRENVIIRLTDTTSNLIEPIAAERNHAFRDNVVAWGKITKNLRVWDYAITFAYPGLPVPTASTYPTDLRFLKANNVDGIFVEHEFPILADMRDFKVWMQCKLFEDPDRSYDALVRDFTDGFYGPAGAHVRRYIYMLQNEASKVGKEKGFEDMSWFVPAKPYNYLSLDFLTRADKMFDDAERAAGTDKTLQRRIRHARLPLDRFMVLFHKTMTNRWVRAGHTRETMPLKRDAIAARYLQAWNEQIDLRLPEAEREAERKVAADEVKKLATTLPYVDKIPARFRDLPTSNISVYGPRDTRNYGGYAQVVPDADSEIGEATQIEIDAKRLETTDAELQKYKMPMAWGVWDVLNKKELVPTVIKPESVPGPGYHWYRLDEVTLTSNTYVYFTWSWFIQLELDSQYDEDNPNQKYEIWANIKFEGPMFPHGQAEDKNSVSVERIVLVKK